MCGRHVSPLGVLPREEDVLDADVVVGLLLDSVLEEGVEHEEVDHHVGGNEEPDVNHFEVWGDRQSGLDTGNYGYNHQHQSQTHHYTVLNNLIELKMKVLKY